MCFEEMNEAGKYKDDNARIDVLRYILNPYKVVNGRCGSFLCGNSKDPNVIADCMEYNAEYFGKNSGVRLRHFVISFLPYEVNDPITTDVIGYMICKYISNEYQVAYAVHHNDYYHLHFVMNSVSFIDGHRYQGKTSEYFSLKRYAEKVLKEKGLRTLRHKSQKIRNQINEY